MDMFGGGQTDAFGNPIDMYGNPIQIDPMMQQELEYQQMLATQQMMIEQQMLAEQQMIQQQQAMMPNYVGQEYQVQNGYVGANVQFRGYDRYGNAKLSIRKYNKETILQGLINHIFANVGGEWLLTPDTQSKIRSPILISEYPDVLRHACPYRGIIYLYKNTWTIENGDQYYEIPYYFCNVCGELFYPQNIDLL